MLWSRFRIYWKELGRHIGDFQARLLLTLFYFTIFVPYGLVVRLLSDPLRTRGFRGLPSATVWLRRTSEEASLERAQHQF